jgi:uncharacterized protein (UPF0332 family)
MYDWNEYLEIAKELYSNRNNSPSNPLRKQTMLRNAISRAYYAAFHKSQSYLVTHGWNPPRDEGSHRSVINNVDKYKDANETAISTELDRAFTSRKRADYDNVFPVNIEKEADATIKRVSKIVEELGKRRRGLY